MALIPLIMKMPTRHQAIRRGRNRVMTGGPLSSILSEAFKVSRYQKYMEGVVRAHSGSGDIWLWTSLLDRVTIPLFINPSPPPSSYFFFLLLPASSLSLLTPFSSSKFPSTTLFPLSLSLSLPPHQSQWSSSVEDTAPMERKTGRTDLSRR